MSSAPVSPTVTKRDVAETLEVLAPGHTYGSVTDKISAIVLTRKTGRRWYVAFGITFALVMVLTYAIGYLLAKGVGIWGVNVPVAWGFAIVNFVWWIGIGHAGTFISAFLLLLRQDWRTSINRFAEAMTLFAVACAGLFPILHLGRQWVFYWLFPYPNTMLLWPQFRSPLVWDVFAVSTYATISLLFWYVGLVPDLATLRDRSQSRVGKYVYGVLALGWIGSARHWHRYQIAYLLLAGLAAPLVISVHSIVGMDFAASQVPGWHSTIFPPYFVAGAIFSGFAMVVTLAIPLREIYGLKDFITLKHLENCARLMLVTGLIVAYGYGIEVFMGWYSGNPYEEYMVANRGLGPYRPAWSALILCNVIIPQLLWFRKIRRNVKILFLIALVVNVGMWLERYVIVITSLHRDFLPSSWGMYYPTIWDWATYVGTIGLFLCMFFLFIRFLPVISIFEMRELVKEVHDEEHGEARVTHPHELAVTAIGDEPVWQEHE
jgi:molybdopterin-containing oxidoreductase family membrane subunit